MPEDKMDGNLGRKVRALREYYTPSFPDSFEGLCSVMDEVGMIDSLLDPDSRMISMKTLIGDEILGELMSPERGIIAVGVYDTENAVLLEGVMNTYMTYRSDEDRDRIFGTGRVHVEDPRSGKSILMDKKRIFAYDQKAQPVTGSVPGMSHTTMRFDGIPGLRMDFVTGLSDGGPSTEGHRKANDEDAARMAGIRMINNARERHLMGGVQPANDRKLASKGRKYAVAMMALPNVNVVHTNGGIEVTDTRLLDATMKEMELIYSHLDGDSRLVRNMAGNQRLASHVNRHLAGASADTQKAVYRVLAEMAPYVPGRGLMDVLMYRDKLRAEGKDDDIIADIMARRLASDPSFRGRSGHEVMSYARKLLNDASNAERKQLIKCLNMANEAVGGKPYVPEAKVLTRIAKEVSDRNGVLSAIDTPDKAMGLYTLAAISPEMLPETLDAIEGGALGWKGFNVMAEAISTAAEGYFNPDAEYRGDLKEARETIREDFFEDFLLETVKSAYRDRMAKLAEAAEARSNSEYAKEMFGDELEELYDRMEQLAVVREMNELARNAPESAGMTGPAEDIKEYIRDMIDEYESRPEVRIYRIAAKIPVTDDMRNEAQKKAMSDFDREREEKIAGLRGKGGLYNRAKALLMEHTTVIIEPTESQMRPYIMRNKLEMAKRRDSSLGNVNIDSLMGGRQGTNYLA